MNESCRTYIFPEITFKKLHLTCLCEFGSDEADSK